MTTTNTTDEYYAYLDLNGHIPGTDTSFYDPTYTYSYDKYSCIRGFFFAHVVMNYFIFLSGIGCMVSRLSSNWTFLHAWFGRVFILSMLWSTCTSLLIHNTGLPLATLISFAAVMIFLTIGWIVIVIYKQRLNREATLLVQKRLMEECRKPNKDDVAAAVIDLAKMHKDAVLDVIDGKTFVKRFFSLKTLHGVVFFASWFQIAGRIFASNQSGDFTCHTYPVYKPIDTAEGDYGSTDNVTVLVPENDPNYDSLPWANNVAGWSLGLIFGSAFAALVVGAIWNYVLVWQANKRRNANNNNNDNKQTEPGSATTSMKAPPSSAVDCAVDDMVAVQLDDEDVSDVPGEETR